MRRGRRRGCRRPQLGSAEQQCGRRLHETDAHARPIARPILAGRRPDPCRSGSPAQRREASSSIGPIVRQAVCLNSISNVGASTRLASMNLRHLREANCGSLRVTADRLQNRPMSRFFCCTRSTWTQRNSEHVVEPRDQARLASAGARNSGGSIIRPSSVRSRVSAVVAHFALRQRDDRLQVKVDAAGVERRGWWR